MYSWYSDAELCIVYLEDVGPDAKTMKESEWFERGWTLQELIAPKSLSFYDRNWQFLGTKSDFLALLTGVTKIPERALTHSVMLNRYSVAQRMSWAATRTTERIEDRAYSLMGLFNVNMEMIYGEKEKAFLRLQRHIIEDSADESIFAWDIAIEECREEYTGLLAPSPSAFRDCSSMLPFGQPRPFRMSNLGLSLSLQTYPYSMDTYRAFLQCADGRRFACLPHPILIKRLPTKDQYVRVKPQKDGSNCRNSPTVHLSSHYVDRQIYVRQTPIEAPLNCMYGFQLRGLKSLSHDGCHIEVMSRAETSEKDLLLLKPGQVGWAGIVKIALAACDVRWMRLGFDEEFNPLIMLAANELTLCEDPQVILTIESFDAAARMEPDASARAALFTHDVWLESRRIDPKSQSRLDGPRPAVVRIDRRSGDTVDFKALGLRTNVRLRPKHSQQPEITEGSSDDQNLVWVVYVTRYWPELGPSESRSKLSASASPKKPSLAWHRFKKGFTV